jgi:hypothetical protein
VVPEEDKLETVAPKHGPDFDRNNLRAKPSIRQEPRIVLRAFCREGQKLTSAGYRAQLLGLPRCAVA